MRIHLSLLELIETVKEESLDSSNTPYVVISRLTLKFPTMEQVHERYDLHFAELREKGDKLVDAKEGSFYKAIQENFDELELGSDRTAVIDMPFIEINL